MVFAYLVTLCVRFLLSAAMAVFWSDRFYEINRQNREKIFFQGSFDDRLACQLGQGKMFLQKPKRNQKSDIGKYEERQMKKTKTNWSNNVPTDFFLCYFSNCRSTDDNAIA